MISFFTKNLFWTQVSVLAMITVAVTIAAFFVYRPFFYVACVFLAFCLYFFRNPDRVCQEALLDSALLICPADGKVVDIKYDKSGGFDGYVQRVSIFLSPLDVHVQWTPTAGTVEKIQHRAGTFTVALQPKASDLNERTDLHMRAANGRSLVVRQIAGFIPRRIVTWVQEGERVVGGYKYGMIRFGSRVDILLPAEVEIKVGVGERVYGGQTVLGRWT